jgi:hypothetical protein
VAFGIVFCLGTLHREFTVFAWPAVVVACWIEGRAWSWRNWLTAAVAAAAVWLVVDLIKLQVSVYGPGAPVGPGETSSLTDEARIVSAWLSFDWAGYAARMSGLFAKVPDLFGGRAYSLQPWAMDDTLVAGSAVAGWAIAAASLIACVRFLFAVLRGPSAGIDGEARRRQLAWPAFLAVVAVLTVAVYGLNGGIDSDGLPVTRYVLFALLAPVALFGAWLLVETNRLWRVAGVALVAVWAAMNAGDSVRWIAKLRQTPPGSEFRYLADDLVAHGVRYGRGQYWDAYVVTFFARERVVVASTGKVRIGAYQTAVDAHPAETATLTRVPCEGGRRVASWCVTVPADHSP